MHRRLTAFQAMLVGSCLCLLGLVATNTTAQDRLKSMPGYEQYQKMNKEAFNAVKLGRLFVTWKEGGKAFEFQKDGKLFRYDIAAKKAEEVDKNKDKVEPEQPKKKFGGKFGKKAPERGRQW
ncbi:MAG: hypothetical protein L0215_15545, partial [Gemmataceae bacterium]|nr:hypothetical protein [Gemmataceae bacterium]